jgi:chemotaxis protein methyltransferase CheR
VRSLDESGRGIARGFPVAASKPEPVCGQWAGLNLKPAEFARVRELAYRHGGIELRDGKQQLVAARIARHLRQRGIPNVAELLRSLETDLSGEAIRDLLDALTTNHTSFLREPEHFEFLRTRLLPWLLAARRDPIRVWCAASSTGEEAYSILFTILDAFSQGLAGPSVEVVATDISTRVLRAAESALYTADRVRGVPQAWMRNYFVRERAAGGDRYRVKPEFARLVRFSRFNLMEPVPHGWKFPVILCRNVMIYFDRPTQTGVVRRLAGCLEPGGYLFVGHAESLTGIDHPLDYVQPAIYRRPLDGAGRGWR